MLSEQFQVIFNKFRIKGCLKTSEQECSLVYVNSALNHHAFFFQNGNETPQETTQQFVLPICALFSTTEFFIIAEECMNDFLSSQFFRFEDTKCVFLLLL